jgi:tol-pal system protein YbgF
MLHSRQRATSPGLLIALLAAGFFHASPAVAADPALEARMTRLERMLNERSLSDLVLQIQQLQQEVQELRGQVETQQYVLRQKGIMASSSFGTETAGPNGLGGPGPFSTGVRSPSSLTFDPARDATTGEAPAAQDQDRFVLPGPAVGSREQSTDQPTDSRDYGVLALPAPETAAGGERDLYRDAFELLKARDYQAARDAFSEMVERYPQGQFADNGRYWLGEIGYVTQDYASAKSEFSLLVREYPLSPKVPSAMLKLGYVSYEQDELADARSVLEEVVRRFPETTEARLAQGRLDRMQREGQ